MLKKLPKETCSELAEGFVQQGFHCSCFARNENLAISRSYYTSSSADNSIFLNILKLSSGCSAHLKAGWISQSYP